MTWTVRVDRQLCQGSGICAGSAPEVFVLDEDLARPREDGTPPDERVLDAADMCPAQAITVLDGTEEIGPRPD
ncbi:MULTISPECIES: ferredoxin [unclassified Streptomyces]|uniref:ferredoxin n=1 Tax=unclassified Streptomyces TaxID=2593676 RepID=UPI0037AD251E